MKKIKKLFSQLLFFVKNPKKIRLLFLLLKSLLFAKKIPAIIPWITFESEEYIRKIISSNSVVFEWGSGGSTVYFSKRVKQIISIEHNKEWFNLVKTELEKINLKNYEYTLIEPTPISSVVNVEDIFRSKDQDYKDVYFKDYCNAINKYPDNYFDVIVVDGRARNGCLSNSFSKLKTGGIIILDNSEREEYNYGKSFLNKCKEEKFYGPGPFNLSFWETTIFIK